VLAQAGLNGEADVLVGTLGKALGSYGAFVCADRAPTPRGWSWTTLHDQRSCGVTVFARPSVGEGWL
jgi:hypothetical protein